MPVYHFTYPEFMCHMYDNIQMSDYQKKWFSNLTKDFQREMCHKDTPTLRVRVQLCEWGKYQNWSYWISFSWIYDEEKFDNHKDAMEVFGRSGYRRTDYQKSKTLWCKTKDFETINGDYEGWRFKREIQPFEKFSVSWAEYQ